MSTMPLVSNQQVADFLLDISIYDHLEEIARLHSLPFERIEELLDLADAVMNGKLGIEKMPEFIMQAFDVDEKAAKIIAADLAGYRLLPLEDYIPQVAKHIALWGESAEKYPKLRIRKPVKTPDSELVTYAKSIGLDLPEHFLKRFVFLAKGYLTKERTRDATKILLMRPLNIGGLSLTDIQAEGVFKKLDVAEIKKEAPENQQKPKSSEIPTPPVRPKKILYKNPPVDLPIEAPPITRSTDAIQPPKKKDALVVISTQRALTREVPVISGSLIGKKEEQEITEHKMRLSEIKSQLEEQEEAPSEVMASVIEYFKKARISKAQTEAFVQRYWRGMFDQSSALLLLTQKYQLHIDDANAVLDELETRKNIQDAVQKEKIKKTDKKLVNKSLIEAQEQEVLALRHAALTKNVALEKSQTVLAGAQVSATRSKEQELALQKNKIDKEKLAIAQKTQKPRPARVELSVRSPVPSAIVTDTKSTRIPVSDVSFTPKLVGPVEELGTMTLSDFRRLSSSPNEATRKIEDGLKLLEELLYEERIAGIQAWKKSPVNRLYLKMAMEALVSGNSITEIAGSRRNKGEESLNPAEIQAIIGLNSRIGF